MIYQPAPAFAHVAGASQPRIVLLGEAWGESEAQLGQPFVGESGKELFRMLGEAMPEVAPELHSEICELHRYGLAWVKRRDEWFQAAGIALTNVLALRPPNNKLEALCGTKKEVEAESPGYSFPPISKGKYLRPGFSNELCRLEQELCHWTPNLVLALGNTATWGLLRATNIGSIRGAVTKGSLGQWQGKVLPTYHPAGVLRQWSWRTIVVADFMKALREAQFPEVRRPKRRILVNPSLTEVQLWFSLQLQKTRPIICAVDTETEAGQITCISFSTSPDEALVVPFWDKTKPEWSYWPEHEERIVWDTIQQFMENPCVELLWQNGLYDFQYIMPMMIRVNRSTEDTMLLHHSLYPEMQKGLGFLGSLYTNEASWKLMRRQKADTKKRDE